MVDRLKKPCYPDAFLPISHDALIKQAVIRVQQKNNNLRILACQSDVSHGGCAPMNFLSSSPTSSLGSEAYEPMTIIRDELQLQSSFRLRIAWFLSFVLPYTVKRSMDLAGALVGLETANWKSPPGSDERR